MNIYQSLIVAIVLLLIGLGATFLVKSTDQPYLRKLFLGAFLVRSIGVYIIYFYLISVGGDGFAFIDDWKYNEAGRRITAALDQGKDGYGLYSNEQNVGYFYFTGWLYSILSPDTLSARMVNAFLSSLVVIFIFEIVREIFNAQSAKIAGKLACFLPNMIFWSIMQFKDAALIFCTTYIIYLVICKLKKRINVTAIICLAGTFCILWFLRKDYCLPLIGVVSFCLFMQYSMLNAKFERMKKGPISILTLITIIIIAFSIFIGIINTEVGKTFTERYKNISDQNIEALKKGKGSAYQGVRHIGFSRYLRINSAPDLYKLPFSVGFTLVSPLPAWRLVTDPDKAGFALYSLSNLFFIMLLPFVFLGFVLCKGTGMEFSDSIILRLFPVAMLIGITIIFMGVLRYKEQLMPYFLIWAAISIYERKRYKSLIVALYLGGAIVTIIAVILANAMR